jgi:hypothetical protein
MFACHYVEIPIYPLSIYETVSKLKNRPLSDLFPFALLSTGVKVPESIQSMSLEIVFDASWHVA